MITFEGASKIPNLYVHILSSVIYRQCS